MAKPVITIGIPFYNAKEYLLDSIKSVFAQTYQDWELILVDDGSTDSSLEIANSIDDTRVSVLSDGQNKRLPARLNQIIDLAKGKYIARMDADDLCSAERIQKQVDFLEKHPEIDLVGTGMIYLGEEGELLGTKILPTKHSDICAQPYRTFGLCHASVLVRKEWYLQNKYDEEAIQAEDFNLWLRSYEHSNFSNVSEPLYYYRCEVSSTFRKRVRCRKTSMKFLFKHYASRKRYFLAFCYSFLQIVKFVISNLICLFQSKRKYIRRRYTSIAADEKSMYENELKNIKGIKLPF